MGGVGEQGRGENKEKGETQGRERRTREGEENKGVERRTREERRTGRGGDREERRTREGGEENKGEERRTREGEENKGGRGEQGRRRQGGEENKGGRGEQGRERRRNKGGRGEQGRERRTMEGEETREGEENRRGRERRTRERGGERRTREGEENKGGRGEQGRERRNKGGRGEQGRREENKGGRGEQGRERRTREGEENKGGRGEQGRERRTREGEENKGGRGTMSEINNFKEQNGRAVPPTSAMAGITIRRFEEDDKESVKEIFTMGMSEHVPSSFMHLLKRPLTQMILMVTFCALLASSKSILLPVVAVTLLLAGAKQLVGYLFNSYIDTSLKKDLNHIQETYLENKDSCFWVAESDGRVVGSVACLPAEREPGYMELKRLSVRRTHRGMGIAKALSRTVADFSRERGFPAVILYTSVVQTDAQRLYENMGYTRIREFCVALVSGLLFTGGSDEMDGYRICRYQDEDYCVVTEVYSTGFVEQLDASRQASVEPGEDRGISMSSQTTRRNLYTR
ncbi:unnamed protein product, partial [Coregonus sp. 'balchen']